MRGFLRENEVGKIGARRCTALRKTDYVYRGFVSLIFVGLSVASQGRAAADLPDGPVRGFEHHVSLDEAVGRIIPHTVRSTFEDEGDRRLVCSWSGGPSWQKVLVDCLSMSGMVPRFTAWGVVIEHNPSNDVLLASSNADASNMANAIGGTPYRPSAAMKESVTPSAPAAAGAPIALVDVAPVVPEVSPTAQPPAPAPASERQLTDWVIKGVDKRSSGPARALVAPDAPGAIAHEVTENENDPQLGMVKEIARNANGDWIVKTETGWFGRKSLSETVQ